MYISGFLNLFDHLPLTIKIKLSAEVNYLMVEIFRNVRNPKYLCAQYKFVPPNTKGLKKVYFIILQSVIFSQKFLSNISFTLFLFS